MADTHHEVAEKPNPIFLERPKDDECLPTPWLVSWLTWPLFLLGGIGAMLFAIDSHQNYHAALPIFPIASTTILLVLETLFSIAAALEYDSTVFSSRL